VCLWRVGLRCPLHWFTPCTRHGHNPRLKRPVVNLCVITLFAHPPPLAPDAHTLIHTALLRQILLELTPCDTALCRLVFPGGDGGPHGSRAPPPFQLRPNGTSTLHVVTPKVDIPAAVAARRAKLLAASPVPVGGLPPRPPPKAADPVAEASQLAAECIQERLGLSYQGPGGVHGVLSPPLPLAGGVVPSLALPLVWVDVSSTFPPRGPAITVDTKAPAPPTAPSTRYLGVSGADFGMSPQSCTDDSPMSTSTASSAWSELNAGLLSPAAAGFGAGSHLPMSDVVQAAIAAGKIVFAAVGSWVPLRVVFRALFSGGSVGGVDVAVGASVDSASAGAAGAGAGAGTAGVVAGAAMGEMGARAGLGGGSGSDGRANDSSSSGDGSSGRPPGQAAPGVVTANSLHLRVVSSKDVGRYLAQCSQRPRGEALTLTTGATELEWLADVMVDGWMQGACVQVRRGGGSWAGLVKVGGVGGCSLLCSALRYG
jgi:hypothetical protein